MMVQEAVVLKTFSDNTAEISVQRRSACGGNCSGCEGCSMKDNTIRVIAYNGVAASAGQRVMVETKSRQIFRYAVIVYILPVLFLIIGYVVPFAAGLSEPLCVLTGFCLLLLGTAVIIAVQRKRKNDPVTYSICSVLEGQ